ncbi:MAG: hypothetical protein FJW68_08605 [Actinobacteria bacterium]|nr:hypothetical protein [Actinomycetota bacterium]
MLGFFLILIIIVIAVVALIIFLIARFIRRLFTPLSAGNAQGQNAGDISKSEQFRQFSHERTEYWDRVIRQQKASGTFDENKRVYEEGQYMGVKYSIVKSSAIDTESQGTEADLIVQMIMFTQVND